MHGGCLCIHLRLQQSHIMLWHWGWFILQPSGCQLEIAEVSNCILIQVFVTISKQTWPNRAVWEEDYNDSLFPQVWFVNKDPLRHTDSNICCVSSCRLCPKLMPPSCFDNYWSNAYILMVKNTCIPSPFRLALSKLIIKSADKLREKSSDECMSTSSWRLCGSELSSVSSGNH